jgi:hypothetical protein
VGNHGIEVITLVTAPLPGCQFSSKIGTLRIKLVRVGTCQPLACFSGSSGSDFSRFDKCKWEIVLLVIKILNICSTWNIPSS